MDSLVESSDGAGVAVWARAVVRPQAIIADKKIAALMDVFEMVLVNL